MSSTSPLPESSAFESLNGLVLEGAESVDDFIDVMKTMKFFTSLHYVFGDDFALSKMKVSNRMQMQVTVQATGNALTKAVTAAEARIDH